MPAFTISIQHIIGSPSQSNQEKNKRHPASQAEKEKGKLCLQCAHAHKQNTCCEVQELTDKNNIHWPFHLPYIPTTAGLIERMSG